MFFPQKKKEKRALTLLLVQLPVTQTRLFPVTPLLHRRTSSDDANRTALLHGVEAACGNAAIRRFEPLGVCGRHSMDRQQRVDSEPQP